MPSILAKANRTKTKMGKQKSKNNKDKITKKEKKTLSKFQDPAKSKVKAKFKTSKSINTQSRSSHENFHMKGNIQKSMKGINKFESKDEERNQSTVASSSGSKLSQLQERFKSKLEGGRFRYINEKLYTSPGNESFEEFQKDPELFDVYHQGYREQVLLWPENPLDKIISWIQKNHPKAVIADMGCGEARLAESVKNLVHSFDLVSRKPSVVACDIARTPLSKSSVDIVVFCLSLMGKNITDFLKEAYRILKPNGILKIIEVRSRFEGDSNGVKKFMRVLKRGGFAIVNKGLESNAAFFEIECNKSGDISPQYDDAYSVKACVYKKR